MGVVVTGAMFALVAGCGQTQVGQVPTAAAKASTAAHSTSSATSPEGEHGHKPGAHGGIIVSIGLDSYHTEAIVEKGGRLRLLMLGKDESRIQEVDVQTLTAYVKAVGDAEAAPIELPAVPQEGDAAGKTSQFVGQLPDGMAARELEVTIPMLRIAGERFRVGFTTETAAHQEDMPAGLPAAEERVLYLSPGGKYTEADILANGKVAAAQKFRGVMASHDMKPKAGDKLCPITNTKANSKFTWVVDGKPYEFCCPPCVDEFVKLAKEQPDAIKSPETYIR
ncbi:MAG TPA: hypothetical protein VM165_16260 [Planctomycetaceae bacterium]|nr:hypothetical protein [Planctomycetaceae bacterium]